MTTIAVTGASGRLGSRIIGALKNADEQPQVIALTRQPKDLDETQIPVREADYANRNQMAEALAGVDTLVLISAPVKPGVDRISLHRNAIDGAKEAGVTRLLYASVIGNGDDAGTWYEQTQQVNRITEADLKGSGLAATICRNGLYLDLDLLHMRGAAAGGVYQNNGGNGRCGYIAIDEIAFATARLALNDEAAGRSFNLIGDTFSQQQLVDCANQVFGLQLTYQSIDEQANVDRLMAHPMVAKRGVEVARMLTGCFQCIAKGAFDVEPEFHLAAGRPAKPLPQQMAEIAQRNGWPLG